METLKRNCLRAILFTMLGLGISFGANASSDLKDPKPVKKVVKKQNTSSTKQTVYIYHLDASGNIGTVANPNPPECSEDSGTYCSVELSAPKPAGVMTLNDAKTAGIWLRTNFKSE